MAMSEKITVSLVKPVDNGAEKISQLEFKEPTGKLISAIGYPLSFVDCGMQPSAKIISAYISRLAGVPPTVVEKLSAEDYSECLGVILGFFGQQATTL